MKQDKYIIKSKLIQSFGKDECCFSLDLYKEDQIIGKKHFDMANVTVLYRYGKNFKNIDSIFVLCYMNYKQHSDKVKELLLQHEYIKWEEK